jgi:hypothetical protein
MTQRPIDSPAKLATNLREMQSLKPQIRAAIADAWLASLSDLPTRLDALQKPEKLPDIGDPLHAWFALRDRSGKSLVGGWTKLAELVQQDQQAREESTKQAAQWRLDLTGPEASRWFKQGPVVALAPAGEFAITTNGDRPLTRLLPAGVYSTLWSTKHPAIVTSPSFKIDQTFISVRTTGEGGAQVRLVLEDHPFMRAAIYKQFSVITDDHATWHTWDCTFWKGYSAHIEIATIDDLMMVNKKKEPKDAGRDGRSLFGISEVIAHDAKEVKFTSAIPAAPLLTAAAPSTRAELADRFRALAEDVIRRWKSGAISDAEAAFINALLAHDLLPTKLAALPGLDEYRKLEAQVPVVRRAPGVMEYAGSDAPLFTRGDHKHPDHLVPRRYLEVLGSQPFNTAESGRRELAQAIASPQNPLTARVAVNRIWHHLFGRGLVPTVDNFGRMGDKPTHPELLDALALKFIADGWSTKKMIHFLVTSKTYQLDSTPTARSAQLDAGNELLSHFRVRRLEAEAIRDNLLAVAGIIDLAEFGPSALPNGLAHTRRSIYLTIRRNSLPEFISFFDFAKPFTTVGKRDSTNMPSQSLTLLNDKYVIDIAKRWSLSLVKEEAAAPEQRIEQMFVTALGRPPADAELTNSAAFIRELTAAQNLPPDRLIKDPRIWQDFAQSLFNLKEFIFI